MIAIVDYGVGNLFSLSRSLARVGLDCAVTSGPEALAGASGVLLPGVGAFGDAADKLRASGLAEVVLNLAREGKPLLGVCLGMQLLFDVGLEYGRHEGLGLIPGEVAPMLPDMPKPLKVPQIGWNSLRIVRDCPLLKYAREGDYVYYVHSYYARGCDEAVCADSEYGVRVPGVVMRGNVFGAQFHPEKSGDVGLMMLRAFGEVCGEVAAC